MLRKLLLALLCVPALSFCRSAAAESVPKWTEVRSAHFVLYTDAGERQGRHIAGQFERMRGFFHDILPAARDSDAPITVFALKDRKGFVAMEPPRYLANGSLTLAGFFQPTQAHNYILLRLDAESEKHQYSTVYHEYTHFLMRKVEWLPLWLNEGLAQFYENTDIYDKSVAFGQASPDQIYYLRDQRMIPLATLLAVDHGSPYYTEEGKGSVFYSESWALTHMLVIRDFERKTKRVHEYALALSHGEDPVTAATHAWGDLKVVQTELERYIAGGEFKQVGIPRAYPVDEASFLVKPAALPDANAARADVLAHVGRQKEARDLIATVLQADAKNAQAHVTLGILAEMDNERAVAEKEFALAVESGTDDLFAHFLYAQALLERGERDDAKKAEASLRKVIATDKKFAPGFDTLAHALVLDGGDLAEAHRLNATAIQLDPTDVNYRLNAAEVMMRSENPTGALQVLAAAKTAIKKPQDVARLEARRDAIERYMAAQAEADAPQAMPGEAPRPRMTRGSDAVQPSEVTVITKDGKRVKLPATTVAVSAAPEVTMPAPAKDGPHKSARGTIASVTCSYPKGLVFGVKGTGAAQRFYTPDMYSLTTRTVGYVTKDEIDPCKAFEGRKVRVEYLPVQDKEYAGQVTGVDLER